MHPFKRGPQEEGFLGPWKSGIKEKCFSQCSTATLKRGKQSCQLPLVSSLSCLTIKLVSHVPWSHSLTQPLYHFQSFFPSVTNYEKTLWQIQACWTDNLLKNTLTIVWMFCFTQFYLPSMRTLYKSRLCQPFFSLVFCQALDSN